MAWDENNEIGKSPLDLVRAAAFNKETATYEGHLTPRMQEELDGGLKRAVDCAIAMGMKIQQISRAELEGKLKAAIEAGKLDMESFYRSAIDDLEE